jgi:3-phosphoshikimate 1-carboxyvinyltransferase
MVDWTIENRGPLRGEIEVPGDKSISHRAIILGAIANGESRVRKWLFADDVLKTIRAFQGLGVEIDISDKLAIKGQGRNGLKPPDKPLDLGNSGTGMRLIAGVLAGQPFETVLTGDQSLQRRPMKRIIEPLRMMGAEIQGRDGEYAPLKITGRELKGIDYNIPMASAQVKSAILLASLFAEGKTRITEPMQSRDHTERMLRFFGVELVKAGTIIEMECGQELRSQVIEVPGDISSAAFFMVAGLIVPGSRILLRDVGINPTRSGIIDALKKMGAHLEIQNLRSASGEPVADIYVHYQELQGTELSGELVPRLIDELPVLCVAAAMAEGVTTIRNAQELRVKESDRISSMSTELRKMGVKVDELEDGLVIEGAAKLKAAEVLSHGDHRVAMSLAVASLVAKGKSRIKSVEWVETSFPGFLKKLNSLVA